MAPPRRVLRQQLEILIDFLEGNKDMSNGLPRDAPVTHQEMRQRWAAVAKRLNTVPSGRHKSPDDWKRYWFEWRHKIKKKARDARRFHSAADGKSNRLMPLDDLEVRVLELSGVSSETSTVTSSSKLESLTANDSDSEQNYEDMHESLASVDVKKSHSLISSKIGTEENSHVMTPPPKWALDLEERRIAAEERMAEALQSMADIMRAQEERRNVIDNRVADAVTAIAGTIQDLNSGIQDTLQHLQQLQSFQSSGPDIKHDIFS